MTPAQQCMAHPRAFAWRVLCGFRANQGLLLAGAIAYYALLSIVPLLILSVIALSHVIPEHELLATIGRYLAWLVPSQSNAVVTELRGFLDHRDVVSWLLLRPMLFFSSLAFAVLENALSVIFVHRIVERQPLVGDEAAAALHLRGLPGGRAAAGDARGGRAGEPGRVPGRACSAMRSRSASSRTCCCTCWAWPARSCC